MYSEQGNQVYPAQPAPMQQAPVPSNYYPAQQPYQQPLIQQPPAQQPPAQQQAYPPPYQPPVKQPSGWGKLFAAMGLALLTLIVQVFGMLMAIPAHSDDALIAATEVSGGLAALLFVVLLGGKHISIPSLHGLKETWRILRWVFLVDGILVIVEIAEVVAEGSFELAQLWPLRILMLVIICAGIGLYEESLFRGLVFHGLLARMGITKRGMFWAVVISSLIFGVMHIDPTSTDFADPVQALQALLKIAQTGMFGFAAAVAVLKTENLWPVILLHGANDFMLMFTSIGLAGDPLVTDYVTDGEDAWSYVLIFVVLCIAYIPSVVSALRTLKELPAPNRGAFYKINAYPAPMAAPAPAAAYAPANSYAPATYASVPTQAPAASYDAWSAGQAPYAQGGAYPPQTPPADAAPYGNGYEIP